MAQETDDEDLLTEADDPVDVADDKADRSEELCRKEPVIKALVKLYALVEQGFADQNERADKILDYWSIYNCELGSEQFYNGNSQIFVPIVQDAINARKTRFLNQIFPRYGKCVEVTSEDGDMPYALMSLLEAYIKKGKLRTVVAPALLKAGDVEGQFNLYTGWLETTRYVAFKKNMPLQVEGDEDVGLEDPDESVANVIEETIKQGRPYAEVISDADVLVLPQTADSIEEALADGGSVTIMRRWSEAKVRQEVAAGNIDKENGLAFADELGDDEDQGKQRDTQKKQVHAAGIQHTGRGKHGVVYETWTMLKIPGKGKRLCKIMFAGKSPEAILSARRNPYWNDKCPLLSVPLEKVHGAFKGRSKVADVDTLQYQANDATNEGMDSAAYALMPIVMTDPEKNPRVGSMIMDLAAVWETSPKDTQFAQFPIMVEQMLAVVGACRSQIMTTLSVNPAAITQQTSDKKPSQADIANEQQIDILTTADVVTVLEEGIFTPLLQRWIEYDHQFRDKDITVREYGQMGLKAQMDTIPPIQFDNHYQFRWFGVEQARSAQQLQQQIAVLNVVRGIPPQMYQGYKLNLAPVISRAIEGTFGPELAPLIFEDLRSQLSEDPMLENEIMVGGMWMPAHPLDNHQEHIKAHMQAMQETGDQSGQLRVHIMAHQQMMLQAAQAQVQASEPMPGPQGEPGAPPGGGQPGISGTPRMGAQPGAQRPAQGPPGMIAHDQMNDPRRMPRPQRGPM